MIILLKMNAYPEIYNAINKLLYTPFSKNVYGNEIDDIMKNNTIENFDINILGKIINFMGRPHNLKQSYKNEYYYRLYEILVNGIIVLSNNNMLSPNHNHMKEIITVLLAQLTTLSKGQILLNKLSPYLEYYDKPNRQELVTLASEKGTMGTFIFWLNSIEIEKLNNIYDMFIDGICNPDDRIYRYMLNVVISKNKLYFQQNKGTIEKLLNRLLISSIPPKYILKRIKLLSQQIALAPYLNHMIQYTVNFKILVELIKYYYVTPLNFNSMCKYVTTYSHSIDSDEKLVFTNEFWKTPEEKLMYSVIVGFKYNMDILKMPEISEISEKQIIEMTNNNMFINLIYQYFQEYKLKDMCPFIQKIMHILSKHLYINKAVHQCVDKSIVYNMLPYTRYQPLYQHSSYFKQRLAMNYALHRLRLLVKRKIKNKRIMHYSNIFKVMDELKNYEPKQHIKVLSKGSENYQQNTQKFTNLPPRHLYPGELSLYGEYMLREKADGILINNLPTNIQPYNSILHSYQIKAEYIEEMDLYLVFDIDIPNMKMIDRYNMLRSLHPITHNTELETIESLDQFISIFSKERKMILQFIKDSNEIKWYPKFSVLVTNPDIINKQLLHHINHPKTYDIMNTEPYQCDGFILSPFNSNRDIKIKPTHLMTIDVLYKDNMWFDRENNNISCIICNTNKVGLRNGSIYRCNPIILEDKNVIFNVDMYRYDKKRPNPQHIINSIINLIKTDWVKTNLPSSISLYYPDKKQPLNKTQHNNIITQLQNQEKILKQELCNMKPENKMNWLDLGCGSGKAIPYIMQYNPKYYMGLDCDVRQLIRCLKYHDMNQDIYNFTPCDLSSDWNDNIYRWQNIPAIKFDYIVANFSLMHFFTDKFWSQLEQYVHIGTKFIFNLVNMEENMEWRQNESYLKRYDDKVEYYFEWLGEKREEKYIDITMMKEYLSKYNWKVNTIYKLDQHINANISSLHSCYSWYCVEK
jgi:hypothetical protein